MRNVTKIGIVAVLAVISILIFRVDTLYLQLPNSVCRLPSKEFTLQWRHSVEKQLWQEHYIQQGNSLILDKIFQQTFGAGSPASGEYIPAPKGFVGYRAHIVMPQLHWVVSSNMQGVLFTDNSIIPVFKLVPDYTEIKIIPTKQNLISFVLGVKCNVEPTSKTSE